MPDKKRGIPACVAEIKRINARFRKMKSMDGPVAQAMMTEKDRLIDEMADLCNHMAFIATRGAKAYGRSKMRFPPRRICVACGYCEAPGAGKGFRQLAGTPARLLPVDDYLVQEGLIVRRLGINI